MRSAQDTWLAQTWRPIAIVMQRRSYWATPTGVDPRPPADRSQITDPSFGLLRDPTVVVAEDDAATTRLGGELGGHGRAKRVEHPLRPGEVHPARQVAMFHRRGRGTDSCGGPPPRSTGRPWVRSQRRAGHRAGPTSAVGAQVALPSCLRRAAPAALPRSRATLAAASAPETPLIRSSAVAMTSATRS